MDEQAFFVGYYKFDGSKFVFHNQRRRLPHPWRETYPSLVFIGDYERDYMQCLAETLHARYPRPSDKAARVDVSLRFEPLQALQNLLNKGQASADLPLIGGAAQVVKIYEFGNSLPLVVRASEGNHYLFGRKLFDWEKTEKPIIDLSVDKPRIAYPMVKIPTTKDFPDDLFSVDNDIGTADAIRILWPEIL